MNQIPYCTNYLIWGITSGCIFLALGFVDPVAGATWKGDNSLWSYGGILVHGDYICSRAEILTHIAFLALLLAVPAALLGWVVQALVIVLGRFSRNVQPHSGTLSQGSRDIG